jgi:hypothetical protein
MKKQVSIILICLLAVTGAGLMSCDTNTDTVTPPVNSNDSHKLVYLEGDRVLDIDNDGNYRIYIYDRNARGDADPLTGPEVWGKWNTIKSKHNIVYLGNDRVLDVDSNGNYKIWVYDRSVNGNADPFVTAEVKGKWDSIRGTDQLIYLGNDRVLQVMSSEYFIWVYDRSVRGNNDPFPEGAEVLGKWNTIGTYHDLYYLGSDHVLDVDDDGNFRIYIYDRSVKGENDPFPGGWEVKGQWKTIDSNSQLVYLGQDRVLDLQSDGDYRIWVYDRSVRGKNDPFPGGEEVYGNWKTIRF